MTFQKILFSLIIISILAAAGIYFYKNNSSSQQQNITLSPTDTPSSATAPTTAITETQIGAKVLQFYNEYAQFNEGGLDTLYQKGYLTEDSYQELKKPHPLDPVLCTQGGSQSPFEVDSVTLTGQTATVIMKQYFEGSKSYNYSKVEVQLPDQKIASITCNYTK
jgi:hypothetical protein